MERRVGEGTGKERHTEATQTLGAWGKRQDGEEKR